MNTSTRCVSAVVILLAAVLVVGCSNDKAKVETVPAAEPTAVPTPAPTPVPEEVVAEPVTETIVSEEVAEELPEDIVILNARGYLDDVYFETDRYDLDDSARDALTRNASWLKSYQSVKILVEGHCDERNTRDYNLALGERRASTVRDYLVFLGIGPARIRTVSYGEEKPFGIGHDEAAWQLNRRAHFVITAR